MLLAGRLAVETWTDCGRSANSLETLIFNDRNNVGASHRSSLKLGNNKLATKSLSFSQPPFQKFIAISCKFSQNGENLPGHANGKQIEITSLNYSFVVGRNAAHLKTLPNDV